jgi:hypothetical protein
MGLEIIVPSLRRLCRASVSVSVSCRCSSAMTVRRYFSSLRSLYSIESTRAW